MDVQDEPPLRDAESAPSSAPAPDHSDDASESRGQKRKWDQGPRLQHGSRGRKGKDLGRNEYFRKMADKRTRNDDAEAKRQKEDQDGAVKAPYQPLQFTEEEIAADSRKPKRKVAVLIGYSGTGYKGMQVMPGNKTIEGDLFAAFVAAGAISKANADDPKKSALVRCARTDKGVHAAGNVISLKLIIEEPDIVEKINSHLPPQIRIWGMERTIASFSCYQACDSRWYEYLIPTHCFLPPHPSSFLGKTLVQLAEETGDLEGYKERQREVLDFWDTVEAERIKPIVDALDEGTQNTVRDALAGPEVTEDAGALVEESDDEDNETSDATQNSAEAGTGATETDAGTGPDDESKDGANKAPLDAGIKSLKEAYIAAKRAYRIQPERLERVRQALAKYVGTNNFHNFTVKKSANDPSAQRHIRSFNVAPEPILVGGGEWISMKVHGQSFMMHQIRKMVGLAALAVRCGTPLDRITEAMQLETFSIPKAPGLGLLLERPVFDSYNDRAIAKFAREKIDFGKYEEVMEDFKRREIYDKIYLEDQKENIFGTFFNHIDNFKQPTFLYLSSKGLAACESEVRTSTNQKPSSRKNRHKQKARRDAEGNEG
ncbi:pseudouridine synthase [Trichodelitschia bisporula]|uniref:tRNA pseudouridine synthase 1 n=1 Tax=Trichodelitschia bisporula TaxID=703511 RepID=A0A6G1HXL7_9PEZI|nr:pseudouridine synthase [Trichodelitschia bisporula]